METTQKARRDPETLSPLPLSGDDSQRDEERAIGTAYKRRSNGDDGSDNALRAGQPTRKDLLNQTGGPAGRHAYGGPWLPVEQAKQLVMSHMQLPSPHVTIPHFLAGRSSGTNRHIE